MGSRIPPLIFPFQGEFPVTFSFGAQPDNGEIQKKFKEWGIIGHHGIDFGLPEGTKVLAVDKGIVEQAGNNGDFGISVMIRHKWGKSLYAHLSKCLVTSEESVKLGRLLGLSGSTAAAFGPHLHFGMKSLSAERNNGYLGFIDPEPYLPFEKRGKP